MRVYSNPEYRVEYADLAESARQARARAAGKIREFRACLAVAGMARVVRDFAVREIHEAPARPGSSREYQDAWWVVRELENYGVNLDGLPCGADDSAYETALDSYETALSVVRHYGRPLP